MKQFITTCLTTLMILCFCFSSTSMAEKLTFATLNWEPFYGENLPENGFFAALSREAFKRAGYDLELEFMPWKRALELAKRGKYDGILGAYYNKDRTESFYFTDPVSQNEEVFIQKKGRGITYSNLDELKKYKVGSLLGSAQGKELGEMGFSVEDAPDEIMNLKKLNAGRVDLFVLGKQQLYFKLKNVETLKPLQDAFEVLDPPFKSFDLYCPITKKRADGEEIVKKFNAALNEMKSDGTYNKILERFGQK